MEWVSRPVYENKKHLLLAVASVVMAGLSVGLLTFSWGANFLAGIGWGVLAGLFLLVNLRKFFFSTRYRLDETGITVKEPLFSQKRTWDQCKSLRIDRYGVLVSPFGFETRLENFRGVYLRFSDNKKQVMAFLNEKLEQDLETASCGKDPEKPDHGR